MPNPVVNMQVGQSFSMNASFFDTWSNPMFNQSVTSWASTDSTIAAVNPGSDGVSATVNGVAVGKATVTATGPNSLSKAVDVQVAATQPASMTLSTGTPQ